MSGTARGAKQIQTYPAAFAGPGAAGGLKSGAFPLYAANAPPNPFEFTSGPDMTTDSIPNITVATQASVYFGGKCVSHGVTFPDGTKKSVGVILPSSLVFKTGAPEIMECTGGACEYKLAGSDAWVRSVPGEKFSVPGNDSFDIRVSEADGAYHYICHFG
jgi:purine/pyrimidine-nucleoside phosphorylase